MPLLLDITREKVMLYSPIWGIIFYTKSNADFILNGRQTHALLVQSEIVFPFSPNFKHLSVAGLGSVRRNTSCITACHKLFTQFFTCCYFSKWVIFCAELYSFLLHSYVEFNWWWAVDCYCSVLAPLRSWYFISVLEISIWNVDIVL